MKPKVLVPMTDLLRRWSADRVQVSDIVRHHGLEVFARTSLDPIPRDQVLDGKLLNESSAVWAAEGAPAHYHVRVRLADVERLEAMHPELRAVHAAVQAEVYFQHAGPRVWRVGVSGQEVYVPADRDGLEMLHYLLLAWQDGRDAVPAPEVATRDPRWNLDPSGPYGEAAKAWRAYLEVPVEDDGKETGAGVRQNDRFAQADRKLPYREDMATARRAVRKAVLTRALPALHAECPAMEVLLNERTLQLKVLCSYVPAPGEPPRWVL